MRCDKEDGRGGHLSRYMPMAVHNIFARHDLTRINTLPLGKHSQDVTVAEHNVVLIVVTLKTQQPPFT
jgi:hypothetical protein